MGMNMSPKMRAVMIFGLPAISFLFFMNWAAAISFYFFCNTILAIIQAQLFKNERFRAAMNIYPLKRPESEKPILSRVRKASTVAINELPADSTGVAFLDKIMGVGKGGDNAQTVGSMSTMKKSFDEKTRTKVYDTYEKNRLKKKAEERERAMNEARLKQQELRMQREKLKEMGEKLEKKP